VTRKTAFVLLGIVLAWGEWENWRASRRLVGPARGGAEAVVVLGYRNRGATANAVNRWRVRAGVRSIDPAAHTSCLVLSGGSTAGPQTEAAVMAAYARTALAYPGQIVLEEGSRSTWENVTNVLPLIVDADQIKIVSNPMHALKARAYLQLQRPDLASRITRSSDYRLAEWLPLKPLFAAYGRWTLRGINTGRTIS
jgi:uncharacterized SAM-binding protein YcdF (DUF218 family)